VLWNRNSDKGSLRNESGKLSFSRPYKWDL
jgi:hypothetical protein